MRITPNVLLIHDGNHSANCDSIFGSITFELGASIAPQSGTGGNRMDSKSRTTVKASLISPRDPLRKGNSGNSNTGIPSLLDFRNFKGVKHSFRATRLLISAMSLKSFTAVTLPSFFMILLNIRTNRSVAAMNIVIRTSCVCAAKACTIDSHRIAKFCAVRISSPDRKSVV